MYKSMADLHSEFLKVADAPMFASHDLPVKIVKNPSNTPVIPLERWKVVDGFLKKRFNFLNVRSRNRFLNFMLEFEEEHGHCSMIHVEENYVEILVQTKDIGRPTEIDKEYAKFANSVYKDVFDVK